MISDSIKIYTTILVAFLLPIHGQAQRGLYVGENVPINFYGKVEDQGSHPVAGAKISILLVITHYAMNSGEQKEMTAQTDENGNFSITDVNGHGIHISSMEKEGYKLSRKSERDFVYGSPHTPPDSNPDRPIIFRMWKLAGKEALIGSSWHGKISEDGTTNTFNLLTGRFEKDGNMEIACTRPPSLAPDNRRFSFQFVITIPGGGIQPTDDEFTYLAPENGYRTSFVIEENTDAATWKPDVNQEFYIKTSAGHYGRLFVECYPWQTPRGHCEWDCFINPSGSRNLER